MWRGHHGCGRPPSRMFKQVAERTNILAKLKENDWNCPRPRAHWICRAAILQKIERYGLARERSGGHGEGSRLAKRWQRLDRLLKKCRRPTLARPGERWRTPPSGGRRSRGRRLERWGRRGAAQRSRPRGTCESGAGSARGHRDRPGRLRLFTRLWSAADLLSLGRDHRDRRGLWASMSSWTTPRLSPT